MRLPFTVDQFFVIFHTYNEAVWPLQIGLNAIALLCIVFLFRQGRWSNRFITFSLALLWTWMAIVYHFSFFSEINPAAYVFAFMFLLEAVLLCWLGVFRHALRFRSRPVGPHAVIGAVLLLYGLIIYPLLNFLFARSYPDAPTFGVPCPTTIFTIGMFFFLEKPFPEKILWIPILWSLIGSSAAVLLDVPADLGLTVSALLAIFLLSLPDRENRKRASAYASDS